VAKVARIVHPSIHEEVIKAVSNGGAWGIVR